MSSNNALVTRKFGRLETRPRGCLAIGLQYLYRPRRAIDRGRMMDQVVMMAWNGL
jgi:hypothetical protein